MGTIRKMQIGIFLIIIGGLLIYSQTNKEPKAKDSTATPFPTPVITIIPSPTAKPILRSSSPVKTQSLNGGDILSLVNSYRSGNGLPAWGTSDELCRFAESRASYLIGNDVDFFRNTIGKNLASHPGFITMLNESISKGEITSDDVAENLAKDARTDQEALKLWKNSPAHNSLLLSNNLATGPATKACVATRMKDYGSITVLDVGDK